MITRTRITNFKNYFLKILIIFCSLGGVLISFFRAQKDGFSTWYKRTMYFTAQSNLWIGLTTLIMLVFALLNFNKNGNLLQTLFTLKYIFTVSITMTAIVFFALLIPFADKSFHIYSLSSFLTHVFSPLFSILDWIFFDKPSKNKKTPLPFVILPPLFYTTVSFILSALKVDFGRGVKYPYIFLSYTSPAGIFGFSKEQPVLGLFYWILILSALTLLVGFILLKIKTKPPKNITI